jgi:hypothetical protein
MATAPLQLAIRDTVKETATGAPPARQPLTQIVHPHIEHKALVELLVVRRRWYVLKI